MKKIIAFILAGALTFSLAACNNDGNVDEGTGSGSQNSSASSSSADNNNSSTTTLSAAPETTPEGGGSDSAGAEDTDPLSST